MPRLDLEVLNAARAGKVRERAAEETRQAEEEEQEIREAQARREA